MKAEWRFKSQHKWPNLQLKLGFGKKFLQLTCLVIVENDVLFCNTDLVILTVEVIFLKNESSHTLYFGYSNTELSCVAIYNQYTL